jgi:hypothetical protein
MKKVYEVKRDFRIGECNIELKKGTEVHYDDSTNKLFVGDKNYESRNLKAAIKALWLVPKDGKYPELDGPLGETETEKMERKRKERFEIKAKSKKEVPGLVKDERQVGVVEEESELFNNILGAEPVASAKSKLKSRMALIEDDTREVGPAKIDKSEPESIKKALGQNKEKKNKEDFKVFSDHYDAESLHVGKYSNETSETMLQGWSKLHWSKKAEVIKDAKDSKFLEKLSTLETSKKIKDRIKEKLESL